MSAKLLDALKTTLIEAPTVNTANLNGSIWTVEAESRVPLPCLYFFEEEPKHELAFGARTDWSVVRFAIVVEVKSNPDDAKALASAIETGLFAYIKANKQFACDGYDRGVMWCLSRGTSKVETFQQQQLVIHDPAYMLTGTQFDS